MQLMMDATDTEAATGRISDDVSCALLSPDFEGLEVVHYRKPVAELWSVTHHMGSQCYLLPNR